IEPPPLGLAGRLLAQEVAAGRLTLDDWDQDAEQWILRLNLLGRWCPELSLHLIDEEERKHLIEQICDGSFTYKEMKDKPVKSLLRHWLSAEQQQLLKEHAPERLSLSNGRTPKIAYDSANPPHIAIRIQELYGVNKTPIIAMGRVTVS